MARVPSDSLLDRATDPEYAAVSVAAVIGLLLSALGVTALILHAEFLLVVPVTGLVISAVALRRIARARGVLTGKWLALAGIGLGGLLALIAGGGQWLTWRQRTRVLDRLRADTTDVVKDVLAADYEAVLRRMPPEMREAGPDAVAQLRRRFAILVDGAGPVTEQCLRSLRPRTLENGDLVAQARIRVTCERRIFEIAALWWRPRGTDPADPAWLLGDVYGEETFESVQKFGSVTEPRATPPPASPPTPTP